MLERFISNFAFFIRESRAQRSKKTNIFPPFIYPPIYFTVYILYLINRIAQIQETHIKLHSSLLQRPGVQPSSRSFAFSTRWTIFSERSLHYWSYDPFIHHKDGRKKRFASQGRNKVHRLSPFPFFLSFANSSKDRMHSQETFYTTLILFCHRLAKWQDLSPDFSGYKRWRDSRNIIQFQIGALEALSPLDETSAMKTTTTIIKARSGVD